MAWLDIKTIPFNCKMHNLGPVPLTLSNRCEEYYQDKKGSFVHPFMVHCLSRFVVSRFVCLVAGAFSEIKKSKDDID